MLNERVRKRLAGNRKTTPVTLRIPVDAVDSMKRIAPLKGLSGYQTLLKAYISEGLRRDEAEYLDDPMSRFAEVLRKKGVDPAVLESAVREVTRG
jgi:hypothetical protein